MNEENIAYEEATTHEMTPEEMRKCILCMSDGEIALFASLADLEPHAFDPRQFHAIRNFNGEYIEIQGHAVRMIDKARQLFNEVYDEELEYVRSKTSWMHACMQYADIVYGVLNRRAIARLYNKRPGIEASRQMTDLLFNFVNDYTHLFAVDGKLLKGTTHRASLDNYIKVHEAYPILLPSYTELKAIEECGYPANEDTWIALRACFLDELDADPYAVEAFLCDLYPFFTSANSINSVFKEISKAGIVVPTKNTASLEKLLVSAMKNSRVAVFNGNRRAEAESKMNKALPRGIQRP